MPLSPVFFCKHCNTLQYVAHADHYRVRGKHGCKGEWITYAPARCARRCARDSGEAFERRLASFPIERMVMDYEDFLKGKTAIAKMTGIECCPDEVSNILKPHQKEIVAWAIRGGRRAIFASFGLGKTLIQLEIMRILSARGAAQRLLIIMPLGVRQEFKRDAEMIGIHPEFVRHTDEVGDCGIYLTNYESIRDGRLDPNIFDAVSLDEASVLRSYGSKTYQTFLTMFDSIPFKFVATATPSPNRYKEIIHYAGFLGIMDTGQALTRFFQRDSTQANNLTLYPHKEREFWLWLHSWAIFLQKPSDLNPDFSDAGYDLPELIVHYHEIPVDHSGAGVDRDGQSRMFRDAALGVTQAAREKRDTLDIRIEKMVEIINSDPDSHYLLWHDLESERHVIKKAIPEAVEVYGSQDLEKREQNVIDFSDGKIKYLATKPELSGSGCNFQRHCHKAIFLGIGFMFNDFIQSIHRIYRFLQDKQVEIHVIYAESESQVLQVLKDKWERHNEMVEHMSAIIREHGLGDIGSNLLKRSLGIERVEFKGEKFITVNNDCVDECRHIESNSIDEIVTSIPFSNHYEYTPSYNDFGHTDGDDHFFSQMDFLTPELLRILKPGRVACIHTKDRIMFGNVTGMGMPTVNPFHAKCIFHYQKHGFAYMGMVTVVTDVVRENNQTYRLGWTENCKDGTKMGVGSPEYIILLRKLPTDTTRAYADNPVVKSKQEYSRARWQVDAHAFWRSDGNRLLNPDELSLLGPDKLAKMFTEFSLSGIYKYDDHVMIGEALEKRGALPATFMAISPGSHHPDVWHDINRMNTLNGEQSKRCVELHICALQLDIIERLIKRYSNEGELILDPFGGLGSTALQAIKMKRRGYSIELNPGYWKDSCRYLSLEEKKANIPTLFDAVIPDCFSAA